MKQGCLDGIFPAVSARASKPHRRFYVCCWGMHFCWWFFWIFLSHLRRATSDPDLRGRGTFDLARFESTQFHLEPSRQRFTALQGNSDFFETVARFSRWQTSL
jgi:hypothetical protein